MEDIKEVLKRLMATGATSRARLRQNTVIVGGEQRYRYYLVPTAFCGSLKFFPFK